MDIDEQRITAVRAVSRAVRTLEALGYTYEQARALDECLPPVAPSLPLTAEADAMYGALMRRVDALADCTEGSDEEAELKAIVKLTEAYEVKRWPNGREAGGKGLAGAFAFFAKAFSSSR
jgi:hypothetical protein